MGHLLTIVGIIAAILLALYVVVCEFLDIIGRLEVVESKWPRAHSAMSNRPMRLVLICLLIVLDIKDISDRLQVKVAPLNVVVQSPPAPLVKFTASSTSKPAAPKEIEQISNRDGTFGDNLKIQPCGVAQIGGNGNIAMPTCAPAPPKLTWHVQKNVFNPHINKSYIHLILSVDRIPPTLAFIARCNQPCFSGYASVLDNAEISIGDGLPRTSPDAYKAEVLISPRHPLGGGQRILWEIVSTHGTKFEINGVEIVSEDQAANISRDREGLITTIEELP